MVDVRLTIGVTCLVRDLSRLDIVGVDIRDALIDRIPDLGLVDRDAIRRLGDSTVANAVTKAAEGAAAVDVDGAKVKFVLLMVFSFLSGLHYHYNKWRYARKLTF